MDQQKRYQIFVSSTFADLEEERGKVMETILSYDCFPAGMEMFPAMDEEIFKYLKRIIDDSDYYILIIGGRYGSLADDGMSWTEKEYDYAVSKGIPIIVFDHKDLTELPADKTDMDDKKRKKLIAFKKKVSTGRLIKKWTNADNLALAVATSLKSVLQLHPRIGWVRADNFISVSNEADSLEIEEEKNEENNKELESYRKFLEELENNNSSDIFSNGGSDHASILISRFFNTSKIARIYYTGSRKDLKSSEPYWRGIKDFLKNPNHKLLVLIQRFDYLKDEPLLQLLKQRDERNNESIQVRIVNENNKRIIADLFGESDCNFAVFDDDKFRFEYRPEIFSAFCSFNRRDECRIFIEVFDSIFIQSETIEKL